MRGSPVSSRSESPLSDAKSAGLGRFSTHFYGMSRTDVPYTDSDGLYDYPSSETVLPPTSIHRRHARKCDRRRERKTSLKISRLDHHHREFIGSFLLLVDNFTIKKNSINQSIFFTKKEIRLSDPFLIPESTEESVDLWALSVVSALKVISISVLVRLPTRVSARRAKTHGAKNPLDLRYWIFAEVLRRSVTWSWPFKYFPNSWFSFLYIMTWQTSFVLFLHLQAASSVEETQSEVIKRK